MSNGGFEAGATGFASDYTLVAAPTACCVGLYREGSYAVVGDGPFQTVASYHQNFSATAHSGDAFLAVNGASTSGAMVWSEHPISVAANTTYTFSAWVTSLNPRSPAQLEFAINGTAIGATVTPSATVGIWSLFSATWQSGDDTEAAISLVNRNLALMGNDFGLDDIMFAENAPAFAPTALLVAEPWSASVLGLGLVGFGLLRRREDGVPA